MSNAQLEYGIWNLEWKLLFINVYINSKFKRQKVHPTKFYKIKFGRARKLKSKVLKFHPFFILPSFKGGEEWWGGKLVTFDF